MGNKDLQKKFKKKREMKKITIQLNVLNVYDCNNLSYIEKVTHE